MAGSIPPHSHDLVFDNPADKCLRCPNGGYVVADLVSGDFVCRKCGLVQGGQVAAFCYTLPLPARRSLYKRIHHFSERMAQWCCVEPRVPQEILALVAHEAQNEKYERTYGRETVCEILRAVTVPDELAEKYRSRKFKKNKLTKLNGLQEKWKTIRQHLTKEKPEQPPTELVDAMRSGFLRLQPAFEANRHVEGCDRGANCHKRYGCRHNILNLNFLILKLIRRYGGEAAEKKWGPEFRQISQAKRRKLQVMYDGMTKYAGWTGDDEISEPASKKRRT